jgi:outer membrane protein TolC
MKNCLIIVSVIVIGFGLIGFSAQAQQTTKYKTATYNPTVDSVAEGLVAMAMNNASIRSAENFATQFKYLYKGSKTQWMNNIILQGNLNEYSINQTNNTDPLKQSTQYPRYNIGVLLPIGMFVNSPKQVKADYFKYQSTVDQIAVEKQNVRRDVLIYYQDYIMNKRLLSLHQEIVNDWHIIHLKNEQKFTNGEITLEAFSNSTKTYTEELNRDLTLTDAMKTAEARLEALIGMNVEDAIAMVTPKAAPKK